MANIYEQFVQPPSGNVYEQFLKPPTNEIPRREGTGVAGGAPRMAESPLVMGAELAATKIRENPVVQAALGPVLAQQQFATGALDAAHRTARTILRAFGVEDEPGSVERAISTFGRGLTPSTTVPAAGELAGDIALSVGALKGGGALLRKGAELAPRLAPALTPAATLVETGGMRSGLSPATATGKTANVLARVAAGGATGAGTAALTGGDPFVGGVVGAVAPPAVSTAARGVNMLGVGTGKAATDAGLILKDALGDKFDVAVEALRKARPGVSASQVLEEAGIGDIGAFHAVQDAVKGMRADVAYDIMQRAQAAAQRETLNALAGGATQTEARAAREAAARGVSEATTPLREAALDAAQATTRGIMRAQERRALGAAVAEEQTAQAKRLLGLSERQAAKATAPVEAVEPSIGELPMLRGPEQRQAGAFAQQAELRGEQAARLGRVFGNTRNEMEIVLKEYEAAGLKPLKAADLAAQLRGKLTDPAFAGNAPMRAAYKTVIKEIENARLPDGTLNPYALDAIRKNAVNSIMPRFAAGDPTAAKKAAEAAMAQINPRIKAAIEEAGGKGYNEYLTAHSQRMRTEVERPELAAEALKMFDANQKEQLARLALGGNPDLVEGIFGKGRYNVAEQMGENYPNLERVGREIVRDKAIADQITEAAQKAARDIVAQRTATVKLPRTFNTQGTFANFVVNALGVSNKARVERTLYDALQSGTSAAKLFDKLPQNAQGAIERVFGGKAGWVKAMDPTLRVMSQAAVQASAGNRMAPPPNNAMSR